MPNSAAEGFVRRGNQLGEQMDMVIHERVKNLRDESKFRHSKVDDYEGSSPLGQTLLDP